MNNQIDTPVRETEVSRVMENLSKAVECLTQSVGDTEARLSGVVRSVAKDTKEVGRIQDQEYSVELAKSINKIHDKIQSLRERLDDLMIRLEL